MSRRRQELYDRIRATSKDEYILEEMVRLGFWPEAGAVPDDPADEIRRRGELERELRVIRTNLSRLRNVEALRKEARKRRMQASRERRAETKARRERERVERAERWRQRQSQEILYVGEGVSAGLRAPADADPAANKLRAAGLPVLLDAPSIARAMGIDVRRLRWLAFNRRTSATTHYVRFALPKKTGGTRQISAPMPRMKAAQAWILTNVLEKVPVHAAAHGFRRGRSIVTNAAPHTGAEVVVNMDLQDFFPTVSYRRIKGLFKSLGYPEPAAVIFALLCSEPALEQVELDGRTWYVATGDRALPQGAPSSPAITNLICRFLDARLTAEAAALGFTYTRYADDLTFSGSGEAAGQVGKMLARARALVTAQGFVVHPEKTRVFRKGRRQEVTGLVVNDRVAVPRKTLRRFRALLYQIEKDGPAGKQWNGSPDVLAAVQGFANFVFMVDPEKGGPLRDQVAALLRRYRRPSGAGAPPSSGGARPTSTPHADLPAAEPPAADEPPPAGPPAPPAETPPAEDDGDWWEIW